MNDLPLHIKKYFWDCDFSKLSLDLHRNFILGRLLLYGDLKAIAFILGNYIKPEVEKFLYKKGKNCLDKRSFNFWEKLLNVDELWKAR